MNASATTWRFLMPTPKMSFARRAAMLAVLLILVVALAGCREPEAPTPASPSTSAGATMSAAAAPGRVQLGDAPAYISLAATDVTVRAEPGGDWVVAVFPAKLPWGSPTPFLVRRAQRDDAGVTWFQAYLPRRPNGSSGWIRGDQVRLRPAPNEVIVDLSSRTARLLRGWPVGIGQDQTPTPTGRFYLTVKLRPPQISSVYGAWALGISGCSDVLEQFGTGDGQIALHGTNDLGDLGQKVSNGCVRMTNGVITSLAETLPLGTPVTIRS